MAMRARRLALERRDRAGDAAPQLVLVFAQAAPMPALIGSLEAHVPDFDLILVCRREIGSGGWCERRVVGLASSGLPVSYLACAPSFALSLAASGIAGLG